MYLRYKTFEHKYVSTVLFKNTAFIFLSENSDSYYKNKQKTKHV